MRSKDRIAGYINKVYSFFLSDRKEKIVEKLVFITAILLFIVHLSLIALADIGIIPAGANSYSKPLNLLSAIYTPFSIILLYEIYALIYYLPKSLTIYLGKQYEIIVIILIRRIFYDLSLVSTSGQPFEFNQIKDLFITFGSLIIFCLLIFSFYKLSGNKGLRGDERQCVEEKNKKYVLAKKVLSIGLMILFILLFIWSFTVLRHISPTMDNAVILLKKMNNTFFDIFFTTLILTEVLVLLLSFNLAEQFHKIIRNSGFIISTILLKLSFKTEGLTNILIVFGAIAFGVAILGVYRLFQKKLYKTDDC